jgi:hypothetical protein
MSTVTMPYYRLLLGASNRLSTRQHTLPMRIVDPPQYNHGMHFTLRTRPASLSLLYRSRLVASQPLTVVAHRTYVHAKATSRSDMPGRATSSETFYNYTRHRFVYNEEHELKQRRVIFNVENLQRVAVAATGAARCERIEKCVDGMFNKAFILTMDDGQEVVAKLPNPNAGRSHFTTASEVATMDFVRLHTSQVCYVMTNRCRCETY